MTEVPDAAKPALQPWSCPTCEAAVRTLHCASCGEKALLPRDLTFVGLMGQLFQSLSSVDSRLLSSLRVLLTRPGAITNAYLRGPRKPYIGPFQLFLIVNVLFFAVQSLTGSAIFSTSLDSHLHVQDWSALAHSLVERKLAATHATLDAYRPLFDHAVDVNAKSLVILLVAPFALLLILVFQGARRPFVTHLVFSLHLHAFLLACSCLLLLLTLVEAALGGDGLGSRAVDWGTFALLLAAIATYLYFATGAVYGAAGIARVLKVALLTVAVAAAVPGYRFLIFLITLYQT
jgi:Protein of unknown function (DUF3667)